MGWHPSQKRMGALTIAPPKLRQLHTKTAVTARISKLLTKPLPSAQLTQSRRVPYLTLHGDSTARTSTSAHSAGTVTQPSPGIPHGPERSPALTTLQLRGPRMTCAAQPFSAPCPPWTSQRQHCFVEKQPSTNHNPNTEFFLFPKSAPGNLFPSTYLFFFQERCYQHFMPNIPCPLFSPVTLARRRTTNSHVPTRTTLLHSYTIVTSVRRRDETSDSQHFKGLRRGVLRAF